MILSNLKDLLNNDTVVETSGAVQTQHQTPFKTSIIVTQES